MGRGGTIARRPGAGRGLKGCRREQRRTSVSRLCCRRSDSGDFCARDGGGGERFGGSAAEHGHLARRQEQKARRERTFHRGNSEDDGGSRVGDRRRGASEVSIRRSKSCGGAPRWKKRCRPPGNGSGDLSLRTNSSERFCYVQDARKRPPGSLRFRSAGTRTARVRCWARRAPPRGAGIQERGQGLCSVRSAVAAGRRAVAGTARGAGLLEAGQRALGMG